MIDSKKSQQLVADEIKHGNNSGMDADLEMKNQSSSPSTDSSNPTNNINSINTFHEKFGDIVQMLLLEILAAMIIIFVLPFIVVMFSKKHITKSISYTLC